MAGLQRLIDLAFQNRALIGALSRLPGQRPAVETPITHFQKRVRLGTVFHTGPGADKVAVHRIEDDIGGAVAQLDSDDKDIHGVNVPVIKIDLVLADDHAADEAGISRRYGGIHFEEGDLRGRVLGRLVAGVVWDKAQSYIDGSAP